MREEDYRKVLTPVSPRDIIGKVGRAAERQPVQPYVSLRDLNSADGSLDEAPRRPSIVAGLKFSF